MVRSVADPAYTSADPVVDRAASQGLPRAVARVSRHTSFTILRIVEAVSVR